MGYVLAGRCRVTAVERPRAQPSFDDVSRSTSGTSRPYSPLDPRLEERGRVPAGV